jgi:hypothetical protein
MTFTIRSVMAFNFSVDGGLHSPSWISWNHGSQSPCPLCFWMTIGQKKKKSPLNVMWKMEMKPDTHCWMSYGLRWSLRATKKPVDSVLSSLSFVFHHAFLAVSPKCWLPNTPGLLPHFWPQACRRWRILKHFPCSWIHLASGSPQSCTLYSCQCFISAR